MVDKTTNKLSGDHPRSHRLAILGELMSEVVHEVNNLMVGISGYAQFGLESAQDSKTAASFGKIWDCAKLASSLTRNLLRFANPPPRDSRAEVKKAVLRALDLFSYRTYRETGVRITWDPPPSLPLVALPSADLELVLANLVKNALDAVEGSLCGEIRLTAESSDEGLVLGVWNSGPPVSEDVLARLFTPFFTTKADEGGSGLGLSVAHRIVTRAGGTIAATSPESGGMLFTCSLPLASPDLKGQPSDAPVSTPRLDGCHVLVVDDDKTVRDVLRLMLGEMAGALVDVAASGEEARRLLGEKAYDVVLLDILMPHPSGQEVYSGLRERVQKRVVFLTGDTGSRGTRNFLARTGQPALFKPVNLEELTQAVQKVTGART